MPGVKWREAVAARMVVGDWFVRSVTRDPVCACANRLVARGRGSVHPPPRVRGGKTTTVRRKLAVCALGESASRAPRVVRQIPRPSSVLYYAVHCHLVLQSHPTCTDNRGHRSVIGRRMCACAHASASSTQRTIAAAPTGLVASGRAGTASTLARCPRQGTA